MPKIVGVSRPAAGRQRACAPSGRHVMSVLLVEAACPTRQAIETQMERIGYEVHAADVTEAWSRFWQVRPECVVFVWRTPDAGELELCRRLRADVDGRDAYVLFVSDRTDMEDLQLVLDAGADDFLLRGDIAAQLERRLCVAEHRVVRAAQRRFRDRAAARAHGLTDPSAEALTAVEEIHAHLTAISENVACALRDPTSPAVQHTCLETITLQTLWISDAMRRLTTLYAPRVVPQPLRILRIPDQVEEVVAAPRQTPPPRAD